MSTVTQLKIGETAPLFCLPDASGKQVCNGELKGQWIVLYFYPKDNTPGCTLEAHDFSEALPRFQEMQTVVLGVSPDSGESHMKFATKHDVQVQLLSDTDHAVCEDYGVWVKKKMLGKEYMGVERSTFVLDPRGKVSAMWRQVKVPGHVKEVLATLEQLQQADE